MTNIENTAPPVVTDSPAPLPKPVFYHLYACVNSACVEDANPVKYSVHMRGVHVALPNPVNGILCPGCGNEMKPAEHGASADQVKAENMHSKYVIYPAPGQTEDKL